jgi:3-hydroxyacyl-CoA dehydrogenase
MTVRYDVRHEVAVITIDNPPVNALAPGVLDAIEEAVDRGVSDRAVIGLVVTGAGQTFVAGADISIFRTIKTRDQSMERSANIHALLKRIEDASKPLVAAIHGHALGGGLELAMACHFRVSTEDAVVGQPEVSLGIIPGAGGTQRLPRLCGVEAALTMCTEGKPISALKALGSGIVDEIVDGDLVARAIQMARAKATVHAIRRTRDLADKTADARQGVSACAARRAALAGTTKGVRAPLVAVDAIEAAFTMPFDAGSARERELFADCVVSTESRALVHLFFAEREAAKVPHLPGDTPTRPIAKAAVVGAGTMGGGIAMTYANAGIPVLLKEVDDAALDRGMAAIRGHYQASVAKGRMTDGALARALDLITPTTTFDGFGEADVVVEAVFEDMDLKRSTFAELGRVTRPGCLLASNTSYLDLDDIARASGRPSDVVGHHFFSPANVMKLLEIVRGEQTSAETIVTSLALAKRLGKIGVVVGNGFGFVANRMLAYYRREAYLLLEEGASVPQIDRVLIEFGFPVGPFGMQDIAGLDIAARMRQHLKASGKTQADGPQSEVPDRLVEIGRYGQKSGAGWYKYEAGSRHGIADPLVDDLAAEAARRRGIERRRVSDEEIVARITTALANEAARLLEEGYASRAADIDVIYCYGFGFPRYRGGPLFYADTVGLPAVLARVREYRERFGDYWKPAPLIERLVAEGRGFYL